MIDDRNVYLFFKGSEFVLGTHSFVGISGIDESTFGARLYVTSVEPRRFALSVGVYTLFATHRHVFGDLLHLIQHQRHVTAAKYVEHHLTFTIDQPYLLCPSNPMSTALYLPYPCNPMSAALVSL
ncbi:uncharacterized protein [Atheta coriaria]|uniref:uncharacterized protein n=1 Tax=Dalotia coriaria TaxID=877792 RepID=UPI0031F3A0E8